MSAGTVLVTGAGGFVGSAVVRALVDAMDRSAARFADGSPVERVVALLRPGASTERLDDLPAEPRSWSLEYADMSEGAELLRLLQRVRPRAILHLALHQAIFREMSPAEKHRFNVVPLATMFEALRAVPGARFIHTSSAWVLQPGIRLDESAAVEPRMPYAEHKAEMDRLLLELGARTGVSWINLRLFNIFGKYESPSRLLPYLVSTLTRGERANLSHGEQVRDFNDAEHVAQAYVRALAAENGACGRVYHIGSGISTTTRAFAMAVAAVTGNAELLRFGERNTPDQQAPCLVADPSRAGRLLNWIPETDLAARIRAAVFWWLWRLGRSTVPNIGKISGLVGPAAPFG